MTSAGRSGAALQWLAACFASVVAGALLGVSTFSAPAVMRVTDVPSAAQPNVVATRDRPSSSSSAPGSAREVARQLTTVQRPSTPRMIGHENSHAGELPGERGPCADGMLHVRGRYCTAVLQQCLEGDPAGRGRCMRYREPSRCYGARQSLSFCMDRYEWPNVHGIEPVVMVRFRDAERACASRGRRLCREDEWTFACEGEDALPYPYGYVRDSAACTIDHFARAPRRDRLRSSDSDVALGEARRVYEATPSGSVSRCASPFGVYDLTGNVDEWTTSLPGGTQPSTLQGGWWGRVRTRCRPVTRAHGPLFRYYNIGFRCCADVPRAAAAPIAASADHRQ